MRYFALKYIDDEAVIDDVLQDSFVGLWERRRNFLNEQALKVFLYTSIKNACLNISRHQGVRKRYVEEVQREDVRESFLDNILESEIFELVSDIFKELPPACQEVYRLSLEGMSHDEISRTLNITVNTVKKHKNNANHYIRGRLKNIMMILLTI